jgi:hypothetical protein
MNSSIAGKLPFDLNKEYDQSKYKDRFLKQAQLVNPLLFFKSKKRILEAQEEVDSH